MRNSIVYLSTYFLYNRTAMRKENKFAIILQLFITFFKVGILTFGGGYAMSPIIQKEVVEKRKWLPESDILDILAISESTPGPIAVNSATYVGFKVAGFWGSFFATLGLAIPSFAIILAISFFYEKFMTWHIVAAAFKGLKVGVIILLSMAVMKLRKGVKTDLISIILFIFTLIGMLVATFVFPLIEFTIPSISLIFIAIGILVGIIITALAKKGDKE